MKRIEEVKKLSEEEINSWLTKNYFQNSTPLVKSTLLYIMQYYNTSVEILKNMGEIEKTSQKQLNQSGIDYEEAFGEKVYRTYIDNATGQEKEIRSKEDISGMKNLIFSFQEWCKQNTNPEHNSALNNYLRYLEHTNPIIDNYYNSLEEEQKQQQDQIFKTILSQDYNQIPKIGYEQLFKDQSIDPDLLVESRKILVKHNRYCNLKAKLAHTARMVYLTNEQLSNQPITQDAKDAVVMSALYHDIGRFYQAIHYPDFADGNVLAREQKIDNIKIESHAATGYYFSLQNLLFKDRIRNSSQMDKNFVLHSLMTIPIRYHQLPNTKLKHYDLNTDYSTLSLEGLEPFILNAYKLSPTAPPLEPRFSEHQKSLKEFNKKIATDVIRGIIACGDFKDKDIVKEELSKIKQAISGYYEDEQELDKLIDNPTLLSEETYLEKIFNIFDQKIIQAMIEVVKNNNNNNLLLNILEKRMEMTDETLSQKNFPLYVNDFLDFRYGLMTKNLPTLTDKNGKFQENTFITSLVKMSPNINTENNKLSELVKIYSQGVSDQEFKSKLQDFQNNLTTQDIQNILETISTQMFQTSNEKIDQFHNIASVCNTMTTDMDKIDILVQRANGSWELTNGSTFIISKATQEKMSQENRTELLPTEIVRPERRKLFYNSDDSMPLKDSTKVESLWWHVNQFIATNMRNYSSLKSLKDMDLFSTILTKNIEVQPPEQKRVIEPLVKETLAFAEMFTEIALNTRVDKEGNLVMPNIKFNQTNPQNWQAVPQEVTTNSTPSLFNNEQMKQLRNSTINAFSQVWQLDENKVPRIPPQLKTNQVSTYEFTNINPAMEVSGGRSR